MQDKILKCFNYGKEYNNNLLYDVTILFKIHLNGQLPFKQ